MDGPIASAVVLPDEPLPPASPPNGSHKRRQSSVTEETSKRPRLDGGEATNGRQGSTEVKPVRRERGRERRLFGAVLGALSQAPSTTAAQKRRSEIEKRQLAQRKQETEESEQRKAERIARRKVQRWKDQKRFEEASMRIRHDNLLNTAHFLRTETTPHLYYKPWETSTEENDLIQDQIADARATIRRDIEEHEARQEHEDDGDRHTVRDRNGSRDAQDSRYGKSQDAHAPHQPKSTNGASNRSHHSPQDQDMEDHPAESPRHDAVRDEDAAEHDPDSVPSHQTTDHPSNDIHDDNGEDVIEEAAEDTVIY
ncbi:pinin/SDK/memA/ protein conserved region-domain-containing protein [Paraphoma chrysanthemicola]|nr:pinin/SDK/memA/ protein conserved region-domain-containing protein [Paraphoma chrysanthemicola]